MSARRPLTAVSAATVLTLGALWFGAGSATADEVTVAEVKAQIAALSCDGSFAEDQGRIQDDTFALIEAGVSAAELGSISDALNARLKVLNYCVGVDVDTPSAAPTSTTVAAPRTTAPRATESAATGRASADARLNPRADDGSTADTSGTQVITIPEGSVDTGAP